MGKEDLSQREGERSTRRAGCGKAAAVTLAEK